MGVELDDEEEKEDEEELCRRVKADLRWRPVHRRPSYH
jgi:hypothetical protein